MFIEKTFNVVVVTRIKIPRIYNYDHKYNNENNQKITEIMKQSTKSNVKEAESIIKMKAQGGTQGEN
jgi:hypothetical protein